MGSLGRFLLSSDVFTVAGYFWSLFDYGSDIAVGVDYHNRCHFKWAITTFVISFMPNMVFVTCYIFSEHFKNKIKGLNHQFPKLGPKSFTSLMADLRRDINRVSSFSRCLNGAFPWRNCSVKTLVH